MIEAHDKLSAALPLLREAAAALGDLGDALYRVGNDRLAKEVLGIARVVAHATADIGDAAHEMATGSARAADAASANMLNATLAALQLVSQKTN